MTNNTDFSQGRGQAPAAAKEARQHWNRCQSFVATSWDKVLFHFEAGAKKRRKFEREIRLMALSRCFLQENHFHEDQGIRNRLP